MAPSVHSKHYIQEKKLEIKEISDNERTYIINHYVPGLECFK